MKALKKLTIIIALVFAAASQVKASFIGDCGTTGTNGAVQIYFDAGSGTYGNVFPQVGSSISLYDITGLSGPIDLSTLTPVAEVSTLWTTGTMEDFIVSPIYWNVDWSTSVTLDGTHFFDPTWGYASIVFGNLPSSHHYLVQVNTDESIFGDLLVGYNAGNEVWESDDVASVTWGFSAN